MILRTCLVKVRVVDTHAPHHGDVRILLLLRHEDWVRQPVRMQHLHNKPDRQKFLVLLLLLLLLLGANGQLVEPEEGKRAKELARRNCKHEDVPSFRAHQR